MNILDSGVPRTLDLRLGSLRSEPKAEASGSKTGQAFLTRLKTGIFNPMS